MWKATLTGEHLTILQVASGGTGSGGTRQALLLSRGLQDTGHRIVFSAPAMSRAHVWAEELGLEFAPLSFGGLLDQWRSSRKLRALARSLGADVVHAHHTKGHNVAALATVGGDFPPVIANRGVIFPAAFPAKFRSPRTAAVTANSRAVRDVLVGQGIPARKVRVIPNAQTLPDSDLVRQNAPALLRELGLEGVWPVVGAVGSPRVEKGFQVLLEAMPSVVSRFPSAVFLLVGSGMDRFLERARVLGVADRLRLTGYRADARDLMGIMDVLAFPSVHMDSAPNVVLEAMAQGVPVVGSAVGGVAELIEDGVTGTIVAPGRPEALAAATCEILAAPDRGASFGRAGRERLLREFTVGQKVRRTADLYQELTQR